MISAPRSKHTSTHLLTLLFPPSLIPLETSPPFNLFRIVTGNGHTSSIIEHINAIGFDTNSTSASSEQETEIKFKCFIFKT